ncbi:hypothetical protein PINS_up022890 [Pythium insidiosum]|nr:hypothetical protein PINS_up022890 [Pythium insidiosum]
MLYATGLSEDDMHKPQVGIASMWWEGNPCNMHLLDLAEEVKKGVEAAGLVGMRFNTIGVSDGISMGTEGMCYSLQSRELIADSIETVMGGQWYDANISIPGCDKNMPGCVIAMARVNRPSLMVLRRHDPRGLLGQGPAARHCLGVPELRRVIAKRITEEERKDIIRNACPAQAPAAACTRPTRWRRRSRRSDSRCRIVEQPGDVAGEGAASAMPRARRSKLLLEKDIKPRDILSRQAFDNAHRRDHGARWLDERRAAPHRDPRARRVFR